ncbi:hypothetical protein OSB04_022059 [Centaurea solstitialis]|uniref:Uncharacterized protein n=1 Tax=Centaurea solstitialis TaxID=347529 RepID=A0AA38WIC1_9ASTR|nr:hypothetical protein OSB04_022059 [Centaurea solstitialis]
MSAVHHLLEEQVCYVQCGFCTTILLVNVPCSCLSKVVTVKCGHCASLLSVNMMRSSFLPFHLFSSLDNQEEYSPIYVHYIIREEIRRLKTQHPTMSHKQAFSTAAKNWAHSPPIQRNEGEKSKGSGNESSALMIQEPGLNDDQHS